MVAHIDEVADEEMEVDDDGEEQEIQEWDHVRMSLEMIHHQHDHEKNHQVQYDQEQKLCANTM